MFTTKVSERPAENKSNEPRKLYYGIAPVKILAVNPTKEELSSIYKGNVDKDPEYYLTNDNGVACARIEFIVQTIATETAPSIKTRVGFFLQDADQWNNANTKCKVIDKFGRTAWVTKEEKEAHKIPMYSNWPARLSEDYRPLHKGEEDLTNFLKTLLWIPNPDKYDRDTKTWVKNDKVTEDQCVARLDGIADYFKGNITEIKSIHDMLPEAVIYVAIGIRTSDQGKMFENAYNRFFMSNGNRPELFQKAIDDDSYATRNCVYCYAPLREFNVEATDLSKLNGVQAPSAPAAPVAASPFVDDTKKKDDDLPF